AWFGQFYYSNGQLEQGLAEWRRAQELDPFAMTIGAFATFPLAALGRVDEALQRTQSLIELHPEALILRIYFHEVRAENRLVHGLLDEAAADFALGSDMNDVTGGGAEAVAAVTNAYKVLGFAGFWRKESELGAAYYQRQLELRRQQPQARYLTPYKLAGIYARGRYRSGIRA